MSTSVIEKTIVRVGITALCGLSLILVLGFSSSALAQHSHGVLTPGVTFPKDDSVIDEPPKLITMSFRVNVQLMKLALYTADDEWINIGFTYDPNNNNRSFVYPITGEIPASRYYTARWSVLDENRKMINGEFRFAVGDGAIPPSETIESEYSDIEEVLPSTGSYRYTTAQEQP